MRRSFSRLARCAARCAARCFSGDGGGLVRGGSSDCGGCGGGGGGGVGGGGGAGVGGRSSARTCAVTRLIASKLVRPSCGISLALRRLSATPSMFCARSAAARGAMSAPSASNEAATSSALHWSAAGGSENCAAAGGGAAAAIRGRAVAERGEKQPRSGWFRTGSSRSTRAGAGGSAVGRALTRGDTVCDVDGRDAFCAARGGSADVGRVCTVSRSANGRTGSFESACFDDRGELRGELLGDATRACHDAKRCWRDVSSSMDAQQRTRRATTKLDHVTRSQGLPRTCPATAAALAVAARPR